MKRTSLFEILAKADLVGELIENFKSVAIYYNPDEIGLCGEGTTKEGKKIKICREDVDIHFLMAQMLTKHYGSSKKVAQTK